jgi:hypothetical protein
MVVKHTKRRVTRVLIIGVVIAVLSYLFHPEIGQLTVMVNGESLSRTGHIAPFVGFNVTQQRNHRQNVSDGVIYPVTRSFSN